MCLNHIIFRVFKKVGNFVTERLETDKKVIGLKQVKKAINFSEASYVYIAEDAEKEITEEVLSLCNERNIPVVKVDKMEKLGIACGIDINAATAALLI